MTSGIKCNNVIISIFFTSCVLKLSRHFLEAALNLDWTNFKYAVYIINMILQISDTTSAQMLK